ncbi:unnamed protein product [Protopolystoma xenopodis]|uniref:SCP domain-containing protein n=1 Tax=Protopolystoma xenopodis TaxID=117903 RepID=A0A3S5FDC6_9PLAT|nr:unnamed protein product [Protopolystoma xenopodis]
MERLRALHGVPALKLDKRLCEMAQKFAHQLAKEKKLRHSGTEGVGENVAMKSSSAKASMTGKQTSQTCQLRLLQRSQISIFALSAGLKTIVIV